MLFQRQDWTLFRSLDTLGQRAGVPRERLGAIVVKELVDNALDAGSSTVDFGKLDGLGAGESGLWVEDDGSGLPGSDAEIARMFSVARPLTSSKLLRLPTRGALGNGLRVVVGAVLATGGRLTVRTGGRSLRLQPQFHDGSTLWSREGGWDRPGTRVEVVLGAPLRADFTLAELAVAMRGERAYEGRTSAHWYSLAAFRELVSAAPASAMVDDLLGKFDAPRGKRAAALPGAGRALGDLRDDDVRALHEALLAATKAPRASALGAVGEAAGPHPAYACKSGTYDHAGAALPCVVEVWAARTEVHGEVRVLVNRTPVVSAVRHRTSRDGKKARGVLSGCGLNHWVDTGKDAFDAVVNVQTPYMAVTNDGKEPDLRPIYELVAAAFAAACRRARRLSPSEKRSPGERAASKKDAIAAALDRAVAKTSGGGRFRYSLRQLYYAVRPVVGTDLDYGYFSSVVAEIETERGGDLPGIYRDARGQIYEPHTGRTIALGTLAVEEYERPRLSFNKVLYIEKGGLIQLLVEDGWPERHDCALVTSQGFASKACKDVLDLLGDGEEEVEFFCVHDADGPGTLIYEALQEASRARPRRRVRITNLGLEPAEGRRMGLEVEEFERKKGRVPAAGYVSEDEREWLQGHRVELNAMTSPQFVRWLSEKFEERATVARKVVPRDEVVREQAESQARGALRKRETDELLRRHEAEIAARVEERLRSVDLAVSAGTVGADLRDRPQEAWRDAVAKRVASALSGADR